MENEQFITLRVPASLIVGLADLDGAVLLYVNKLQVSGGFQLERDEFVTSLRAIRDTEIMAGYKLSSASNFDLL